MEEGVRPLPLNLERRSEGQPFGGAEGGHMRKVGYVPEYNVLFLNSLIVFIVTELPSGAEDP